MTRRFPLCAMMAVSLLVVARTSASDRVINVTTPVNGAHVPWRACVLADLVNVSSTPVVVVHPIDSSDFYVQPLPTVSDSGRRLKVLAYFGEVGRQHVGRRFELRAFHRPSRPLREGQVLVYWPEAEMASEVVEVVRDDGADNGCEVSAGSVRKSLGTESVAKPDSAPRAAPTRETAASSGGAAIGASTTSAPLGSTEGTWGAGAHRLLQSCASSLLGWWPWHWLVWLLLIALVIRPDMAIRMDRRCHRWIGWGRDIVVGVLGWALAASQAVFGAVAVQSADWARRIWAAKGPFTTFSAYFISVARLAVLPLVASVLTLGDALVIRIGVSLVLPAPTQGSGGVLDELLGNAVDSTAATTSTWPSLSEMAQIAAPIWQGPVGFMAVGLAVGQALLGLAIFGRKSAEDATSLSPRDLWRAKPLPTSLFCVLNLALALLAAYRGYEYSPNELSAVLPTTVALLIGIAMPLMLAYAVHLLFEAFTDVVAIPGACAVIFLVGAASLALIVTAALTLVAAVAAPAALLGLAVVVRLLVGFVLWSAVLIANAIRTAYRFVVESWGLSRLSVRASRSTAVVTLLVALLSASFVSAQATTRPVTSHDPGRPHSALVLCVDTSTSVERVQFAKAKAVLEEIVMRDVHPNDVAWLILIGGDAVGARLFRMPYVDPRRSYSQSTTEFDGARAELLRAISALEQKAGTTDLRDAVDEGLELLASRASATRRTLVIASDFVQDLARGRATVAPPSFAPGASARGVRVALLHTRPTSKYLATLQLSPGELYSRVKEQWPALFLRLGGGVASVQQVDGLAAGW